MTSTGVPFISEWVRAPIPRASNIEELGAEGMRFQVTAGEDAGNGAPCRCLAGTTSGTRWLRSQPVWKRASPWPSVPLQSASSVPPDKRGEVLRIGDATVINDCYNSNPEALKSMISTLAAMPAKRRILVAGEMLELGPESISVASRMR